jgi:predicted metal-binding membrane protein
LAGCRGDIAGDPALTSAASSAWRHGLRLGLRCVLSCAPLIVLLFVFGMMTLWAMVLVTAAITLERLLPDGIRAARVIGASTIIAGLVMVGRAVA